ncbi:MAG: putative toxin-antitoxin system toxin component, PIN family [Actinobacteria bacterium]|nr:putative toxin-antitoxin system toxin component, PIN family [Actinomycetota bacterium]MCL5882611.1 putative toxin-antitoxin system toxin component, PIN family [Actinomycetota bacterium]
MYPKVVLDTNVLVSALNFGGNPDLILRLSRGRTKRFDLFLSPFILKELSVILSGKFFWSTPRTERATQLLVKWGDVVSTKKSISAIPKDRDDDDNRILECAVKAKADFIVSGDKHLLNLKKYEGIRMVTPAQFLKILEKSGGQN